MILGLRCSSKDYAFAVIGGTKGAPTVAETGHVQFPKGFSRVQCMGWFCQELEALLAKHSCTLIAIKGFEGRTRDKSFVERVEHESAAYIAAGRKGIKGVVRKVKSTMAKDLGLKGRAHYLPTLDTTGVPGFDALDEKTQEAVLVAWSELR
jgi:hypothetical protein